jgi:chromosome segregation ATPase
MTHQEKKFANLLADYETVKAKLDKAMELIEQYTSRIEDWNRAFQAVNADREFLLESILNHKKTIVLPTKPDQLLYANAKEVARNPSK